MSWGERFARELVGQVEQPPSRGMIRAARAAEIRLTALTGDLVVPTPSGPVYGPCTLVAPGSILLVLASEDRVVTVSRADTPGLTGDLLSNARAGRWAVEVVGADLHGASLLGAFVAERGTAPGEPAADYGDVEPIAAVLFGALGDDEIRRLADYARDVATAGYVPALVALVAEEAVAWPLGIALPPCPKTLAFVAAEPLSRA